MAARLTQQERRQQIVEATLTLLASSPLDRVTTRAIAKEVGLTQPGLFRHFRSRDEILVAVVEHARGAMAKVAEGILSRDLSERDALHTLMNAVLGFAVRNRGIPRLLFHDIGCQDESDFRRALMLLVSMQRALLAALIESAIDAGALPEGLDSQRAAELGLACVQGLLLQWQLGPQEFGASAIEELESRGAGFVDHWIAGLEFGLPQRTSSPAEVAPSANSGEVTAICVLDVRPILASGSDPASDILGLLARLPAEGVLKIIAPFRPAPLLALIGSRGLRCRAEEATGGLWAVEILGPAAPEVIDLRDLEVPEPLERVLLAVSKLGNGCTFIARLPRFPRLLIPRLEARGLRWTAYEEFDGTAMLHVLSSGGTGEAR